MDMPYHTKSGYTHLSITLSDTSQLSFISQEEAQYRLGGSYKLSLQRSNSDILADMKSISTPAVRSMNQQILTQMISNTSSSSSQILNKQQTYSNRGTLPPNPQTPYVNLTKPKGGYWGCFSVLLIALFFAIISCLLQDLRSGKLLHNSNGIHHHATLGANCRRTVLEFGVVVCMHEVRGRLGPADALKRCAGFALETAAS